MAMDSKIGELSLSLSQLEDIRDVMAERVREGLRVSGSELAMLPTYLPGPPKKVGGEALVVDVGGTNLRASRVKLGPEGRALFPAGERAAPLRHSWESSSAFFSYQASLAREMKTDSALPLGYCFSYPARSLPDRDAVLLRWTKDLRVPGVVGERVGRKLKEALREEGIETGRVSVLNDTVAALLGGCWAFGTAPEFGDFIGLIVGTGTNLAAFFPVRLISSRPIAASYRPARMAVNLESGNFHPPHLSRFDDELDGLRPDAGKQRLEKAVSGKFLPELYGYLLSGRPASSGPETKELFRRADREAGTPPGALAAALINRSADLVAAALAGLIRVLNPEKKVGILAEGSVINQNPAYRKRVREKLVVLLGGRRKKAAAVELFQLEKVNLIGAALAALI